MNPIKKITNFLFEVGTLRKMPRAHRQTLFLTDPTDNISSHSFRVAVTAYFLAKKENVDIGKTVIMALFHDIPETRSGDQNWVHKKYVKVFEDEIIQDQIGTFEDKELMDLILEYQERKTPEARLAKDADIIDQLLLIKEHDYEGNKQAESWMKGFGLKNKVYSETAKELLEDILTTKPNSWWANLWTSERR